MRLQKGKGQVASVASASALHQDAVCAVIRHIRSLVASVPTRGLRGPARTTTGRVSLGRLRSKADAAAHPRSAGAKVSGVTESPPIPSATAALKGLCPATKEVGPSIGRQGVLNERRSASHQQQAKVAYATRNVLLVTASIRSQNPLPSTDERTMS